MKNDLGDLNNHLFLAMERVNDDSLNKEELQEEIKRSHAVTNIAKQIISNAGLVLRAEKLKYEYGKEGEEKLPEMLEVKRESKKE